MHCDQLFGRGWMDCNSIVKIFLRCPHFDRHGKALQHLITAYSQDMQTYDLRKKQKAFNM